MNRNIDTGLLILRLAVAGLMLFHGIHKLMHGIDGVRSGLESNGLPSIIVYGVYIGEVVAPLMMLVGFRTRIASLFFLFTMIIAAYVGTGGDVFGLTQYGGLNSELHFLYGLGALALFFTGAGRYALSTTNRWD